MVSCVQFYNYTLLTVVPFLSTFWHSVTLNIYLGFHFLDELTVKFNSPFLGKLHLIIKNIYKKYRHFRNIKVVPISSNETILSTTYLLYCQLNTDICDNVAVLNNFLYWIDINQY